MGPLVTISFSHSREGVFTRHWYQVPRIGDAVEIGGVTGSVRDVLWGDDGHVTVVFR